MLRRLVGRPRFRGDKLLCAHAPKARMLISKIEREFTVLALILVIINTIAFAYAWLLTAHQLGSETVFARRLSLHPNMDHFDKRRPLIYANFIGTCIMAVFAFGVFGFIFSLSTDFPWWVVLVQLLFIMGIDDLWFYGCYRLLHHNPVLFKRIHSIHHRVRSPLPLDYLYVHPAEWMMGTIGIALAVFFIYLYCGSVNAYALFAYALFRPFNEILIHSGMPSRIAHRLKHLGSSEHHTAHHGKLKGNYASTFKWLDRVFDTHL